MSKMPDRLMGGRLLVKVLPTKDDVREDSKIVIPGVANSNLTEGLVMNIDPEAEKFVPKGNIVVFPTGAGVGQYIGDTPMLWLELRDIWGCFSIDEE